MERKNFEMPTNNNPESSEKDEKFSELLAAENEGVVPEEYSEKEVKFEEKNIFEKTVDNIFLKAREMVFDDLGEFLNLEEKTLAEKIIKDKVYTKKNSSLDLWTAELNRLIQEKGDVDEFKKRTANNLYREMKDEILEKLEKNEGSN